MLNISSKYMSAMLWKFQLPYDTTLPYSLNIFLLTGETS